MTTLALSLMQVRSLGDGLCRMTFGIWAPRQHANQQHESFAMKSLSCAPPADLLFWASVEGTRAAAIEWMPSGATIRPRSRQRRSLPAGSEPCMGGGNAVREA
jgi:hypothetical protein